MTTWGSLERPTLGGGGWRRFLARIDWPLLLCALAVSGLGLLNLYSTTSSTPHGRLFDKQVVALAVGVGLFVGASVIDHRAWARMAWPGLAVATALIVAVRFAGLEVNGARRWLDFGAVLLQPSELAKIAVIIALARLADDDTAGELGAYDLAARALAVFVPIGLVALQPDLGSAVLLWLIAISTCILSWRKIWGLVSLNGFALGTVPILLWDHLHPYQRRRFLAFLDPEADPTGAGWHTQQSIYAVGSGRLTGKGFLNGTQNQHHFLPEHWTDFPFSVWAEEWGFVGCLVLLVLYGFLTLWVLSVAMRARDSFGAVLCVGVACMLFWHVVVNVGMALGVAPVVGVTLPLFSYGGSSVVTIFFGLGLVSSVSRARA